MSAELTRERVRELLDYDPSTGVFTWRVSASSRARAGSVAGAVSASTGYVCVGIDGKKYQAHRLAFLYVLGEMPPAEVDHTNHVKTDNRWVNLRHASRKENGRNTVRPASNKSGVTGVWWDGRGKAWRAQIGVGGKILSLGSHRSIDDAAQARKEAERRFGFHPNHGMPLEVGP